MLDNEVGVSGFPSIRMKNPGTLKIASLEAEDLPRRVPSSNVFRHPPGNTFSLLFYHVHVFSYFLAGLRRDRLPSPRVPHFSFRFKHVCLVFS